VRKAIHTELPSTCRPPGGGNWALGREASDGARSMEGLAKGLYEPSPTEPAPALVGGDAIDNGIAGEPDSTGPVAPTEGGPIP
jgi:hypothetical protein